MFIVGVFQSDTDTLLTMTFTFAQVSTERGHLLNMNSLTTANNEYDLADLTEILQQQKYLRGDVNERACSNTPIIMTS